MKLQRRKRGRGVLAEEEEGERRAVAEEEEWEGRRGV